MIYSFIPARAGSSRLKDKYYLMLGSKRLFEWSIDIADKSDEVDKIIFSTDSDKYINYAKSIKLKKDLIIDKRNKPMFIVARGRIELPTPCFQTSALPTELSGL